MNILDSVRRQTLVCGHPFCLCSMYVFLYVFFLRSFYFMSSSRSVSSSSFFTALDTMCSSSTDEDEHTKTTETFEDSASTEVPASSYGDASRRRGSTISTNYTRNECIFGAKQPTLKTSENNRIQQWNNFLTPPTEVKIRRVPPVSSSRQMLNDPLNTFIRLHVQSVLDLFSSRV